MHTWTDNDFLAGHVALDFLNTVADEGKTREIDKFHHWQDVVAWANHARLISPTEARRLSDMEPALTAESLSRLKQYRELAYAVVVSVTTGQAGRGDWLARLDGLHLEALRNSHLAAGACGLVRAVDTDAAGADLLRHRLVLMLMDLLSGPDAGRIRQCGRCSWVFLDRGRGVGRRWCRMSTCGNRAKSERFRTQHAH